MPRKAPREAAVITRAGHVLYAWVIHQLKMLEEVRDPSDFERINGMLLYVDKSVKL